MTENRNRLDLRVMNETGQSRAFAADLIRKGLVDVNGIKITAPGHKVMPSDIVNFQLPKTIYVGRGGYKLEWALDFFGLDLTGKICADIGASTGGFTDCMLQRLAAKVYAVDNGKNQLAEKLRADCRVVSLEETNINEILNGGIRDLCTAVDFAAVDVSFVSITKIIDAVYMIIRPGGLAVLLVKPQFEAGRGNIGKKGIVKKHGVHDKVIRDVGTAVEGVGLRMKGITASPITGREGNIEFLMLCAKD